MVATVVSGSTLPALTLVIAALIQMSIVSVSQASTVSRVARSKINWYNGTDPAIKNILLLLLFLHFTGLAPATSGRGAPKSSVCQIVRCCVAWPEPLLSNIKIALFICDKLVIDKTRLHQNC